MPLRDSYVVWNHKGGVGKTTQTFLVSTEYANRHPDQEILLVDLCPRANLSMALSTSQRNIPAENTISSYLHEVTNLKPLSVVDPRNFLIKVNDFNENIPKNVSLLRGDPINLELMASSLEQKRLKEISKDSVVSYNPWVYVTSCVRYFIEGYGNMRGVAADDNDWVVFIDTDTSFSIYTQMAIVAARRLIIPTNADDFSREAFNSLLWLLYGVTLGGGRREFVDRTVTFSYKVEIFEMRLPKIDVVINNRQTHYNKQPTKACSLMARSISEVVVSAYKLHPELFQRPEQKRRLVSDDEVAEYYCVNVQDLHTVGIAALHTGCPLANLQLYHGMEIPMLRNGNVSLNRSQIDHYWTSLQDLVKRLCLHSHFYCECRRIRGLDCTRPSTFKHEQSYFSLVPSPHPIYRKDTLDSGKKTWCRRY